MSLSDRFVFVPYLLDESSEELESPLISEMIWNIFDIFSLLPFFPDSDDRVINSSFLGSFFSSVQLIST